MNVFSFRLGRLSSQVSRGISPSPNTHAINIGMTSLDVYIFAEVTGV